MSAPSARRSGMTSTTQISRTRKDWINDEIDELWHAKRLVSRQSSRAVNQQRWEDERALGTAYRLITARINELIEQIEGAA
jgi:hypothetical protein